jgi:4-hydroxy-tetrahydrodipicolinate synthase
MIQRLFEEPNPAPVKAAMAMMGQMRDELRSPMQVASAEVRVALGTELKRLDYL